MTDQTAHQAAHQVAGLPLPRPDDLHDANQAAEALGVPVARIRAWARDEKIPVRDSLPGRGRRGRVQLYSLDDIRPLADAYLARRGD